MWRSGLRLSRLCTRWPLCRPVRPLPLSPPAGQHHRSGQLDVKRGYSSQNPSYDQITMLGILNPIIWLRARVYFFIIRTYLDREFTIKEFTEGAKQAFSFVSMLLSQCKFDALQNLVANEILKDLTGKCSALSDGYKKALAANANEIMYSFPGDVSIYYDDDGRKFVSILMRFCYLKHLDLPDEELEESKIFKVIVKNEEKRLLTANYETDHLSTHPHTGATFLLPAVDSFWKGGGGAIGC